MGTASLVLGIIAIVFCFIPGIGIIAPIMGIIGIILGASAKKADPNDGMAKAGFVCSIIGTAISLLAYIACMSFVHSVGTAIQNAAH